MLELSEMIVGVCLVEHREQRVRAVVELRHQRFDALDGGTSRNGRDGRIGMKLLSKPCQLPKRRIVLIAARVRSRRRRRRRFDPPG
jgi:hypothetical protein